ncbi:MAG TPA: hypothetical protein VEY08_13880 [Chloroflexia bacterium]|nr:hypothetical protein [Chloroflexia bacterium]
MFRSRRLTHSVCALAILASLALAGHGSGGVAQAGDGGVIESMTGSGHFTGSNGEFVSFAHNAVKQADGSVTGHYVINLRSLDAVFKGPITCLQVVGNRAWVGGIAESVTSSNPNLAAFEGQEMWFQVADNGEGANDPPDMTTSIGLTPVGGPPGQAAAYCANMPPPRTFLVVEKGNIQVRDGQ